MKCAIACALAHVAGGTPCPILPPGQYTLPNVFSSYVNPPFNVDEGLQLTDINGDGLVDAVWGWSDGFASVTYQCVYLNTQCGWVLQANYTGPVFSCIAPSPLAVELRGVVFPFKGLTVKAFVAEVAEYFGIRKQDVAVLLKGRLQGPTRVMDELAGVSFHVAIAQDEEVEFTALA